MSRGLAKGNMIVENISKTGIGFRTMIKHHMHVQDIIRVKFILDDDKRSEISKSAQVKRVGEYTVGAGFLDTDVYNDTNRILGLYLMPR